MVTLHLDLTNDYFCLVGGQATLVPIGWRSVPAATKVTLPLPSETKPVAGGASSIGFGFAVVATSPLVGRSSCQTTSVINSSAAVGGSPPRPVTVSLF